MRGEFRLSEMQAHVEYLMDALKRAEEKGTLNAVDRSKQYEDPSSKELLRSLNEAWAKIRTLEEAGREKDQLLKDLRTKIKEYRTANIALISVITGLAWEGLKTLTSYLAQLLHHAALR
jgi:hypothetical protein